MNSENSIVNSMQEKRDEIKALLTRLRLPSFK